MNANTIIRIRVPIIIYNRCGCNKYLSTWVKKKSLNKEMYDPKV